MAKLDPKRKAKRSVDPTDTAVKIALISVLRAAAQAIRRGEIEIPRRQSAEDSRAAGDEAAAEVRVEELTIAVNNLLHENDQLKARIMELETQLGSVR